MTKYKGSDKSDPRYIKLRASWEEEQRQLVRKTADNQAAFKKFSVERGKISPQNREAIARALHWKVVEYRETHDEYDYVLLKNAGLTVEHSTKMLDRLVLKPEDDLDKKDLYVYPDKYLQLIRYLAGGDVDPKADNPQAQDRAGRLLYRTSYYTKSSGRVSHGNGESHLIYEALLGMVNRVDQEFHLREQFKEVKRLRARRESVFWDHVDETGEFPNFETWHGLDAELILPQSDWPDTWPASDRRFNKENGLWWPLDGWRLTDEGFWLDEKPRKPDSAFWLKADSMSPNAARVCDDADFFFVPHVYLGLCIDTGVLGSFVDGTFERLQESPVPYASWDEAGKRYKLSQPEYALPDGGVSSDYQFDESTSTTAHWLVIYPHPETDKLVPMIYAMGEFPGAELIPLTPDLIADFGDPDRWKYFSNDATTLLQRLKVLTSYQTGFFEAYESWRETAARFHWNPIFRKHPNSIEDIRYRKRLLSWQRQDSTEAWADEKD